MPMRPLLCGCKDLCDVPMVVEAAAAIRPARGSAPADTGTSVRKQIFRHSRNSTGHRREVDTVDFIQVKGHRQPSEKTTSRKGQSRGKSQPEGSSASRIEKAYDQRRNIG